MAEIRVTTSTGKKPATAKGAAKKVDGPSSGKKETAAPASKTIAKKTTSSQAHKDTQSTVTPEERQKMIAEAAYLRAEGRGFVGGDPSNDWLSAEAEIDKILSRT